jgi:hypothetical protein
MSPTEITPAEIDPARSLEDEEALVAFFEAVLATADGRRDYAALAERDRRYGEDVDSERSPR